MQRSIQHWLARFQRATFPHWKRRAKRLGACLAVGLATAWAAPAEATVVHLEVTPTESLGHAYVVYYHNNSSSGIPLFLGTLPGGQTTAFDHDFAQPLNAFAGPFTGYILLAVHNENAGVNEGVTASFTSDWPIVQGQTFQSLFTAHNGFTEQDVVDGLKGSSAFSVGAYANSFSNILKIHFGSVATLINFSDPALGGTAIATVPEPATWVMLVSAAGAVAFVLRRRVFNKRCPCDVT